MIHIAAKMVLDKSSLLSAFLTALIGTLLGQVVAGLVGGTLGLVLALATWALIAAVFYRTKWVKGAIVGLVAWVLWFLINLAVRALFG